MTVAPLGLFANPIDPIQAYNLLRGKINEVSAELNLVSVTALLESADGTVLANISGASGSAVFSSLSAVFDHDLGSTNGNIPIRSGGLWTVTGTPLSGSLGGTGVANTGLTITIAANLTTTGAGSPTFAFSANPHTYTYPDAAITVAGINLAQTWTTNQTFSGAQELEPYSYNTPATGNTVTMAAYERRCINNPAGGLAALTIVLPPNPVDAQIAGVSSTQAVTTLTVNAGTGGAAVVGAPAALTAGQAFTMLYRSTGNSWYISP